MYSHKQEAEEKDREKEKGKEPEVNPENSIVSSETFVSDSNPLQDELQKTQSVGNDNPDSLTTAGSYIYILEGKIGRIDSQESPKDIIGLCTDNFTTCNILVMFSKDRSRYVLVHMDLSLKETDIQKQIEWLGAEPSLFRVYRTDYRKNPTGPEYVAARRIPNLKNKFIAVGADERIESVHIGYADNYPVLSSHRPMQIQFHSNSVLLTLQHSITGFFGDSGFLSPVMFYGQQWTNYDTISLSSNVIRQLWSGLGRNFNLLPTISLAYIDEILTDGLNLNRSREPIMTVSYLYLYFKRGPLNQRTKSAFLLERQQEFLMVYSDKFDDCHFTETVFKYLGCLGEASNYQELKDLIAEICTETIINIIYAELLKHPRYEKNSDGENKRIATVQHGTLAQYFKLTTVCFELLFHRFSPIEAITQEKQVMPTGWATHFQSSEQQKGESSGSIEAISLSKKR